MADSDSVLSFNGVDAITGGYAIEPMSAEAFFSIATGTPPLAPAERNELRAFADQSLKSHFGAVEGVDYKKLDQTGWGVIFAEDADPAIRLALAPLLKHRADRAGALYREYTYKVAANGNLPENKLDFLKRNQADAYGVVDPKRMPYYLLIVGDPESIPFRFQYQLDVQYGVGRVCFDTPSEYAAYAETVVAAESGKLALPRRAAFFGARNPDDGATILSHDELAVPLADWAATQPAWTIERRLDTETEKATLANLERLLNRDAPAFLFTATHGLCFPSGDPRQYTRQGALVCQDWPGPSVKQMISDDAYFCGDYLSPAANIFGMVAMHFACFGAGTPQIGDFGLTGPAPSLAPKSFTGYLPQRMLAHPGGGALAVIGHVGRAWGCSFDEDKAGKQITTFTDTVSRLMHGFPIGYAMEPFNSRYAEISTELSAMQDDLHYGATPDPYALSHQWTATHDARGYSVIGDPAVRLMLVEQDQPARRPILEVIPVPTAPAPTPISAPTPVPIAAVPPAPASSPVVDQAYLLGIDDTYKAITQSLQTVAEKIGNWLANSFETVTVVQVSTYVTGAEDVTFENGDFTGAKLRAVTIASLDGNTKVCVPEQDGKVDDALWKIHSDTVDRALTNRVDMLKTAATTIASLLPGVKKA